MSESSPIIGIDLGTTNSLAAYMTPGGPVVVRDAQGSALVPSVVALVDGQVVVGAAARAHAVEYPLTTIHSVKRLMGKDVDELAEDMRFLPYPVVSRDQMAYVDVAGKLMTPQELSAIILREVKRRAQAALGQPVERAVITVPAYFDDSQRQATRDAGRIAGLTVERIVNEPTAAALAYGLDRKQDALIAVYDFGGGTFDVSILQVCGGVFQVLATDGDTHLGGDDLDRELIDLVTSEIRQQFGQTLEFPPSTRQALRNFAEATKIRLSERPSARIQVDLGGGRIYDRTVTREGFEQRAARWVDHTIEHAASALKAAALRPDQVDEVVMVGGCTRIPLVRRRVEAFFGRLPYTAINPDEVVAMGAAVQAGILMGLQRDTLLLDVVPLSLGIETMGGAMGKLIMRNSTIPCQAQETFTTYADGQTSVDIHVLQGERELAGDGRSLGRFQLSGIPPMPAGMPRIEVTFLVDANAILNVSARELRSGKEASVQITPAHGLTADEVKRMVKESYVHAVGDLTAHRLIDLRNEAHRVLSAIDQALAQAPAALNAGQPAALSADQRAALSADQRAALSADQRAALSADQRAALDAAVAQLKAKMEGDDPDALDEAMRAANDVAMPLTQRLMDEVLRKTAVGKKLDEY